MKIAFELNENIPLDKTETKEVEIDFLDENLTNTIRSIVGNDYHISFAHYYGNGD